MTYEYQDYEKLKELERVAYIIHQEYIDGDRKSLDEVITSAKAYTDYLSGLKIKYKNCIKMEKDKIESKFLTPIEKFERRNKWGTEKFETLVNINKKELEAYEKNCKGKLSIEYKQNSQKLIKQYEFHLNNLKYSTKILERYQNNLNILARSADAIHECKTNLSKIIPLSSCEDTAKEDSIPASPKEVKNLRVFTFVICVVILCGAWLLSKNDVPQNWMRNYYLMKH